MALLPPSRLRCCLALLCAVLVTQPALAPAAQGADAGVRLGFLFNFGKFATWPDTDFPTKDAPVQICIVAGDPAMSKALGALDAGQLGGRPVSTRVLAQSSEAGHCQMLYLPAALGSAELDQYLDKVSNSATLTVSDREGFARRGGMIELVYTDTRYQFDVNYLAVKRANLKLSSSLLRLARSVE